MSDLWRMMLSFFVWLSYDPETASQEHPRAAAAVACARASMTVEQPRPAASGE